MTPSRTFNPYVLLPRGNGGLGGFGTMAYDDYGSLAAPNVENQTPPVQGQPDQTQQNTPQPPPVQPQQPGTPTPQQGGAGTEPTPQGQGASATPPTNPPTPAASGTTPPTPATPPTQQGAAGAATEGQSGAAQTPEQIEQAQLAAIDAIAPFVEAGIYVPAEGKDYDLRTDEGMLELARDSAQAHVKTLVFGLPPAQREFVLAAFSGASREEMRQLALLDAQLPDYSQYDLTKPEQIDAILTAKVTTELGQGATAEDIREMLKPYEAMTPAIRLRVATAAQASLVAETDRQRATVAAQAQARQRTEQEAEQGRINTQITLIRSAQNIAGLPATADDREALIKFMFERNAEGKTARDLALTPENVIARDYLLMKNFDVSKVTGKTQGNILARLTATSGRNGQPTNTPAPSRDQEIQIDQALNNLGTSLGTYQTMNHR